MIAQSFEFGIGFGLQADCLASTALDIGRCIMLCMSRNEELNWGDDCSDMLVEANYAARSAAEQLLEDLPYDEGITLCAEYITQEMPDMSALINHVRSSSSPEGGHHPLFVRCKDWHLAGIVRILSRVGACISA